MKRGTQVIYVPAHALGDIDHPDVERGFVTSLAGKNDAFCRYWRKDLISLRTTAGSERTPIFYLVVQDSVPQDTVDGILREIS